MEYPDKLSDISPWCCHPVVKTGNFYIFTDIKWSRMAISHGYWHLVIKNGNFTLLLTSSGQEWQFHIATDIQSTRMAISHCYWHQVSQDWQFHIATDIYWSRMAISHWYWHLVIKNDDFSSNFTLLLHIKVIKNGNFTLLLTSSGQEWQFHIATDI